MLPSFRIGVSVPLVGALALSSACAAYKVVDYPSAIEEVPTEIAVDWSYANMKIGRKTETQWLATRKRERARERHFELKAGVQGAYAEKLGRKLGQDVRLVDGQHEQASLRIAVHIDDWVHGAFIPTANHRMFGPAPTTIEARVEFFKDGERMEEIAIDCVVDAKPWTASPQLRFEMCGAELGDATAKYIHDRVAKAG